MQPIVLFDPGFRSIAETFSPADFERLGKLAEIVRPDASGKLAERVRREAAAAIVADWTYGPVGEFAMLRAILEVSGRFPDREQLDYEECARRGVAVLSCAPAFAPAVAEMALAMTLACGRDLLAGDAAMREAREEWTWRGNTRTFLLFEQPVGFIGFGSLARALQQLLTPFRCPIRVYDPGMTDAAIASQGVVASSLDEVLSQSKVVYVLAAPTPQNRGLLSRALLEKIGRDALLVLISRAHLVDFDALTDLLCAGRFRAAIDVYDPEPPAKDHRIRSAPGTLLAAHRAGGDADGYRNIGRLVVDDLEAILCGLAPRRMQLAGNLPWIGKSAP